MGSTTQTPTLNLPLFGDDDKPTWRGDINGAMNSIDAGVAADRGNINNIVVGFDQTTATNIANALSKTRVAGDDVWVSKDQLTVSVLDHGLMGDNVTDDTVALNTLIANSAGRTILFPRTVNGYRFTGVVNVTVPCTLQLEKGVSLNFPTAAQDGIKISSPNVKIIGGTITSSTQFDGANVAWTYAVVNVPEGNNGFVLNDVTFQNIPKVGIGCRAADATITGNRFYGNFPSANFTGTQTAHYAIQLDPPADADGGAGLVANNLIQGCVQGISIANYGQGTGYGYIVNGNRFYNCWNHGIYAQNGVGNVLSNNTFYECQVPIVISTPGAVVGNTIYCSSTGNTWDMVGINGRDLIDCLIANNVIVGDSTPTSVAIGIDSITDTTIQRVHVLDNIIDLSGAGGQSAIRIGTQNKTTILNGVRVNGNTIRTPGNTGIGAIAFYTSGATVFGYSNECCHNNVRLTGLSHGIVVNNQKGFRCDQNTVVNEYNAPSAVTSIHVQLSNCVNSSAKDNISVNAVGFGSNVTIQAVRADTNSTGCTLGPVKLMHETGVSLSTPFVDVGTNNNKVQDIGNYATASTLGAVQGKVAIYDPQNNIVGYVPVYGSIT